jgi:hypothetical protein
LYGVFGQPYDPKLWWQWPVPTFLSNCNHQDSLDVINAIGPLDATQTPADSSVAGKLHKKYIYGVTDSTQRPILWIKKDVTNYTQNGPDDPGHPGYLGFQIANTNFAGYGTIQHEAAGWGMGKWLHNAFLSNMNSGFPPEYTAWDVAYTGLIENNKMLWQTGKQQVKVFYFGK